MSSLPFPTFYGSPIPRQRPPPPPSPVTPIATVPPTATGSTQPRLRAPKRTQWQKADAILNLITKEFRSLGLFLEILFHVRDFSVHDPRTDSHKHMVTTFLGGESNVGMGDIIDLIYRHPQSRPYNADPESRMYFSPPGGTPRNIRFARPALSTWALQIVGREMHRQIGILTQDDPNDPEDTTQLRASSKGRAKDVRLATWDDFGKLSIPAIAATYKRRAPAVWYITECMGGPTANGVVVVRKRRPHPTIQVGVISSLTLSRNRYASGYLALPLAVWQFACKAHVDEKRIMSRFGFTVHDKTARACLDSLTDSSLAKLRESVAEGIAAGTMRWQLVLDNVQQYCRQRDHRIGREDVLKIGTAATAILLEDCAPNAFDLQDHLDRVMRRERRELTIESLWDDIDWSFIQDLTALHWVRILVTFIPQLAHLCKEVSAALRAERMSKLRLRQRKSVMQPLGTNAERETETQGMKRALLDFEKQMGLDEKAMENLIFIPRGDGASIAAIWRVKKFLAAHPSHYKAFRNRVPAGPEIWHTRWTQLNAIASNSYAPTSSPDPSALSKSSTAAGAKRPSNLKKVDFFPTSRSMKLFFEARVLDCWRVYFGADDLVKHFETSNSTLPDLDSLWHSARILVRRYASQQAYNQALSKDLFDSATDPMKVPRGSAWSPPIRNSRAGKGDEDDADAGEEEEEIVDEAGELAGLEEIFSDSESASGNKTKKKKKKKSEHVEDPDFTGDRTLANEILFLQDMSWWVIAAHAVPEGEIGTVWEIMKIWIFSFAGSSNRNYNNYLLETYCLHRYEASKEFSDGMLNNWLVNPSGYKWVECDWSQEDFNKWLEEMVAHKGGDFDDHFYRHTLAPNVIHFLRMKEQIESAFELEPRGKTHGAPHLRNEFQQLLRMHQEDELHLFRSGRTYGHAALNFFDQGYEQLGAGRLDNFIEQSTAYADITADVLNPSSESDEEGEAEFQETLARLLAQANSEPTDASDSDESDSEDGDGDGDIGLRGMQYSDDELESSSESEDGPGSDPGNEFTEEEESDEEGDENSELEEEILDKVDLSSLYD
ncbi:hypothetical protein DFH06DRAFT_1351097 [Mycena polygramma]|nr:hypothetical protein DFH06DRAFT_1351094 [Mycena polygramma]KAJ7602746.1 hypothetical protein DFH06DRAFT_1351097 [Mycena polygramma]